MAHRKHIRFLLRLHKEHKIIKETWDEYNVYFWLISGAAIVGIYLKLNGIFAYVVALSVVWAIGTLRHRVRRHIRKHSTRKHNGK